MVKEASRQCSVAAEDDHVALEAARRVRRDEENRERLIVRRTYDRWSKRFAQPVPSEHPFTLRLASKLEGMREKYSKRELVAQSMIYLTRWFDELDTAGQLAARRALDSAKEAEKVREAKIEKAKRRRERRRRGRKNKNGNGQSHAGRPRVESIDSMVSDDTISMPDIEMPEIDYDDDLVTGGRIPLKPELPSIQERLSRKIVAAAFELLRERDVFAEDETRVDELRSSAQMTVWQKVRAAFMTKDARIAFMGRVSLASAPPQE